MFSQNTSLLISSICLKFFIDLFSFVEKSLQNFIYLKYSPGVIEALSFHGTKSQWKIVPFFVSSKIHLFYVVTK